MAFGIAEELFWEWLGHFDRLVPEKQQLVTFQSEGGVGSAVIINELYFKNVRSQHFNSGSHLSPPEPAFREIFIQSHYVEEFDRLSSHLCCLPYLREYNNSSVEGSPLPVGQSSCYESLPLGQFD